ncbi:hypothetical protein pEaSNUABM14_00189 [Erwinia phage pEa_SNUABM_14]|uniref:Uncharacterized protein n=1 Tax=Erwinia phage pEa_SNUABM_7 TaxID=2866695 RepID=A0AAE8BP49_9CAUD|nr:hypothetical protein MPK74_gp190 [Erwinia phage pEa_SNUABM_7]QYW03149.1 hypothetical protein pEaSNUABM13_00190 [Erwinia phage pEa_SNUABM_13]QYW03490.1 hypothetical protein pEaSNUABM34_00188 [Erwinia phage pEa_SNUABM_34]QYW03832.1 hypothetical protein pEaSNUABM45_00189 [Erwinia phage pEa_SNUABM_45]QYW04173.1 hypothetical protein pEaSNUABM46_00189 [Erwinia phage pEa_SNUABM_46]QYW04514.1 hypothetical protein pEaSNUABM14_00189 [Erwinia phage pEa_SNUABM_14]QYW05203.1 hypothetical protein pEaSNU
MAMTHYKVDRTFKESTFGGQYRPQQMRSASPYVLDTILRQVISQIIEAQMPFTKALNFTLVNVFSTDNQMSMGYSNRPDDSVIMIDSGICFTFCLKPRPNRVLPQPLTQLGRGRYWRLWGVADNNEYLTVGLPRSVLFALNGNGLEFLNVIYNTVGAVTRNYVQLVSSASLSPAANYIDLATTANQVLDLSVSNLMRTVPYDEWHYNVNIWKDYSEMLISDVMRKDFPLYFCMYILPKLYLPNVGKSGTEYIDKTVADFVAKGMMKLSAAIASQIVDPTPELLAALYMLLTPTQDTSDMEASNVERTNFVRSYFYNLTQNMQNVPEYQAKVVRAVSSNHLNMARALISGGFNDQLRNLIEYLGLTKAG